MKKESLYRTLKEDTYRSGLRLYLRILFNINYHAIFLIRVVTKGGKLTPFRIWAMRRLQKKYGIVVHPTNKIGKAIRIGHPMGIIMGETVEIGDNCTIMQNVTIGKKNILNKQESFPIIGNNVIIGAGACVLGNIKMSDHNVIGENAVVLTDIEENSVYAGVPAKRVK